MRFCICVPCGGKDHPLGEDLARKMQFLPRKKTVASEVRENPNPRPRNISCWCFCLDFLPSEPREMQSQKLQIQTFPGSDLVKELEDPKSKASSLELIGKKK
jgi:hypothetical protein